MYGMVRHRYIRHAILVYLLNGFVNLSLAQNNSVNNPPLKFEHFNDEQRMSTGSMVVFFKDSKSFMWFLTTGGINRYDGSEFKIFRNDASDSTTISNGLPTAITEDKNGIIWIACDIPQGLNAYNPVTGKFTRYNTNPSLRQKLPTAQILAMLVDSNNVLWMCAEEDGVYSWDRQKNEIIHFENNPFIPFSLSNNNIINGLVMPAGDILFYSANCIDRFNQKTGKFSKLKINPGYSLLLNKWKPGMFINRKNQICIPDDDGIKLLDSTIKQFVDYPSDLSKIIKKTSHKYISLLPDGRVFINTESGLFIFEPQTKKYSVYQHDDHDPNSISPMQYQDLTYDYSGVMWIRGGSGINKVSLKNDNMFIINNDDSENRLQSTAAGVRFTYRDRSGQILQTKKQGISVFNFFNRKFTPWVPDEMAKKLLTQHFVQFIYQDTTGSYWFGVDEKKLILYNPEAKGNKWTYTENHDFNSLGAHYYQSVLQDNAKNVWFAGAFTIWKYEMTTKKFNSYFIDSSRKKNVINSNAVILAPGDGNVWFGTIGLSRYDKSSNSIKRVSLNRNEAASILSASKITCGLNAGPTRMWIGTDGSGLFLFDFKTQDCRRISVADGLPNDRIFAISRDKNDNLWVSTDGGLCKFILPINILDPKSKGSFKTYKANLSWPAQGYSYSDGTLYFHMFGYTGLFYFHPDSLTLNTYIPPVYITGFRLDNKIVTAGDSTRVLDSAIEIKKRVVLKYDQNLISFTFAALNFINSENNQYAYRLVGFNKNWVYTNASNRVATYTNLDPGKYIFEVRASNNDGIWNGTPVRIYLVITPPYWQTWWFKTLIVLVATGIIYGIYRYRLRQVLKMQMIRNNISRDLHDDLGSTLNSVKIYANVAAIEKDNEKYLEKIKDSTQEAITSVRDIIWVLDEKKDTLEHLFTRISQFAEPLCTANHISFHSIIDENIYNLELHREEKRNLYLIIKEVINNSIKYAACQTITVQASGSKRNFTLQIIDDGTGFDVQQVTKGNGLNNIHIRADEIGYQLGITSDPQKGTAVILGKR